MAVWELQVLEKYYNAILDGRKTIEVRAPELDGEFKYEGIQKGDILEFYHDDDKNSSRFEADEVTYYTSIDNLLEEERWEKIVPEAENRDEVMEEFHDLPGNYNERIEKHGIYAIEIGDQKKCLS